MKYYKKKNKLSKLAKGLLCFLLVLCPMILNVSTAQAVEKQQGSQILDLEEGEVWAEEKGTGTGKLAKESVSVTRLRYNYNDSEEFNTIDWEIVFNKNKEWWNSYKLYALLPETDRNRTVVTREDKYYHKVDNLNVYSDFTGATRRWGYDNPSNEFRKEYSDIFQSQLQGTQSGSDMNTWVDTGRIKRMIISGEGKGDGQYIWRITTYHKKDVALENVPMFALLANGVYKYKRLAAIGPFGIASWHQLKVPKRVYVDDIDNLTQNDKNRIFAAIKEDTDKWLNTVDNRQRAESEENAARQEIIDNTYVKTFSDGSKLKLGLRSFVRQRELKVLNQENVVNWKDSVNIGLGVNDPEFKNEMIAMPAEGALPAGLGWDKTAITTDVPNGKIRGIPDIDWSKVEGEPGKKQVTFKFNLALRKEDGTINTRPETYKPITITVRQDEGAVPVGVEDFPTTPFVLLSMISFSTIMIIFWRRRVQEE